MARMCPDCITGIVRKQRNEDVYICQGCNQVFEQTLLFDENELKKGGKHGKSKFNQSSSGSTRNRNR